MRILETAEVEVGAESVQQQREGREGVDELDEVFGQAGGYPTLRRPFHSRREIDKHLLMEIVNEWYK